MIKIFKLIIILSISSLISAMHLPKENHKRKSDTEATIDNRETKKRKTETAHINEFINDQIIQSVCDPKIDSSKNIADRLEKTSFSDILGADKILMKEQRDSIKKIIIEKYERELKDIIAVGTDSYLAGANAYFKDIGLNPVPDSSYWKISDDSKYLLMSEKSTHVYNLSMDKSITYDSDKIYPIDSSDKYLVFGEDDFIKVIGVDDLKERLIKNYPVNSISISSDNKYIATAIAGKVDLWDLSLDKKIKEFKTVIDKDMAVGVENYKVFFSPNNKYLIATAENYNHEHPIILHIWKIKSGQAIKEFDELHHVLFKGKNSLFSPNNKFIFKVEAGDDECPSIFNLKTNESNSLNVNSPDDIIQDSTEIMDASFSPDSNSLATSHNTNKFYLWDTKTGSLKHIFNNHEPIIVGRFCFSHDSKFIAIASQFQAFIYDCRNGSKIQNPRSNCPFDDKGRTKILVEDKSWDHNEQSADELEFSLDNKLLVTNCFMFGTTLWDIDNDRVLDDVDERHIPFGSDRRSRFTKDGKYIITGPCFLEARSDKGCFMIEDLANAWIMPQLDLVMILFLVKLINSPEGNILENAEYKAYYDKLPKPIEGFVRKYYAKKIVDLYLRNKYLSNFVGQY